MSRRQPWLRDGRSIRRRRKLLAAGGIVVVASAVTLVASAYWRAQAGGTVTGQVAAMGTPTASASGAAGALVPGGSADLTVSIANPNPFAVTVDAIATDPGGTASASDVGCDAAALVTVTIGSVPATPVPAGGSVDVVLAGAVALGVSAPQACQGATFSLPLLVTVRR